MKSGLCFHDSGLLQTVFLRPVNLPTCFRLCFYDIKNPSDRVFTTRKSADRCPQLGTIPSNSPRSLKLNENPGPDGLTGKNNHTYKLSQPNLIVRSISYIRNTFHFLNSFQGVPTRWDCNY